MILQRVSWTCERAEHTGVWSGREDLNLDSFPGREACCNYTTSAESVSVETDTSEV